MTLSDQPIARYHPLLLPILTLLLLLIGRPASTEALTQRTITLATAEWPPYYGQALPQGGLVTEIVRQALQRRGYRLEIKWLPWARALRLARQGTYDGVMGAWYTEERSQDFSYSAPLMKNELVLFKRQDEPIHYTGLQDLKAYRIGVTIDSALHELLQNELASNLDLGTHHNNNIKKLMKKRVDLLAAEKESIRYLLKRHYPEWTDAIEVLEPPLQVNALHLMVSRQIKDHQQLTEQFNQGLQQLISDGSFDALVQAHGFSGDHRPLIPPHPPLPTAEHALSLRSLRHQQMR